MVPGYRFKCTVTLALQPEPSAAVQPRIALRTGYRKEVLGQKQILHAIIVHICRTHIKPGSKLGLGGQRNGFKLIPLLIQENSALIAITVSETYTSSFLTTRVGKSTISKLLICRCVAQKISDRFIVSQFCHWDTLPGRPVI